MKNERFGTIVVPLLFGLLATARALGNPRLGLIHGSDIVELVAIGLCFGMAFGGMIRMRRRKE